MTKFICKCDDCEMPHCKQCGHHYDPYCAYGSNVCDECQINNAAEECENVTKAFNGNYEEAAQIMGW